jgi:hypothetical protein
MIKFSVLMFISLYKVKYLETYCNKALLWFWFFLAVLQIPKKVNWEEYIPQGSDQWESQMVVSRMFDEKPIWSKNSLTERLLDKGLSFSSGMLRR